MSLNRRARGRFRAVWRDLRRYQKGCGRTFNALSGTPLSGNPQGTLAAGASLAKGETVKASALALRRGGEHGVPLASPVSGGGAERFGGAQPDRGSGRDLVLESRKGARGLGRKARQRGGKAKKRGLSREQVPVLMAAERSGITVSAVLPRVDAADSRLPSTRWSRRTPCWSPTPARATHLAPPRSG